MYILLLAIKISFSSYLFSFYLKIWCCLFARLLVRNVARITSSPEASATANVSNTAAMHVSILYTTFISPFPYPLSLSILLLLSPFFFFSSSSRFSSSSCFNLNLLRLAFKWTYHAVVRLAAWWNEAGARLFGGKKKLVCVRVWYLLLPTRLNVMRGRLLPPPTTPNTMAASVDWETLLYYKTGGEQTCNRPLVRVRIMKKKRKRSNERRQFFSFPRIKRTAERLKRCGSTKSQQLCYYSSGISHSFSLFYLFFISQNPHRSFAHPSKMKVT